MDEETTTDECNPKPIPKKLNFIHRLMGKKVTIRMATGGQPITGTIDAYSPYEILVKTTKGELIVFKHSIATIEEIR